MTWDIFWEFAGKYGLAIAGLAALVFAMVTGYLRPQREFEQSQRDSTTQRADWERREADLRRDWERQLATMQTDRDYWRDTAMDLLQRYSREVDTSEAAVRTATRVIGRR